MAGLTGMTLALTLYLLIFIFVSIYILTLLVHIVRLLSREAVPVHFTSP